MKLSPQQLAISLTLYCIVHVAATISRLVVGELVSGPVKFMCCPSPKRSIPSDAIYYDNIT